MIEEWKKQLILAEQSLELLNDDQTATVAKLMALQLGAYRLRYGDEELEAFDEFVDVDELSEKGQKVFIKGMESLLSVVREIETDGVEKH